MLRAATRQAVSHESSVSRRSVGRFFRSVCYPHGGAHERQKSASLLTEGLRAPDDSSRYRTERPPVDFKAKLSCSPLVVFFCPDCEHVRFEGGDAQKGACPGCGNPQMEAYRGEDLHSAGQALEVARGSIHDLPPKKIGAAFEDFVQQETDRWTASKHVDKR